jgi:hypothetical protein
MNWKGLAAQYLTFVVAPLVGALGVLGALRWGGIDRLDPRRFAAWAVGLFVVTRVGFHLVVFHVFRYPGTVDLTDFWQPMARAVLDGRNPGAWADNMSGPLYPFVLAAGLGWSGARYVPGINAVFVAADALMLWLLLRIARRHLPETTARRILLVALVSPMLWVGDVACSQDEVIFACLLLAVFDLAETGRVAAAVVVAALGTLVTKALFPFWVMPVLVASAPGRGAAVRRLAIAAALTVAGIGIAVALRYDLLGHADANRIVRGTTPWAFFVPSAELDPSTYRTGLVAAAVACVVAGYLGARRRDGESAADAAVRGVVAVQAAFFAVSPYSLDYHLAHAWPFLAWMLVREGAAARPMRRAGAVLAAGYCVLPMIGFGIGAEGISGHRALLALFTGWCVFTGWRALAGRPWRITPA